MRRLILLVACALWLRPAFAEETEEQKAERAARIRAGYAKFEYRVPMRDGAHLFTAIYVPNDVSRRHPILLVRTPYGSGPYGANRYRETLGPSRRYEDHGFIFVFQDVRGAYMSEGTFVNMRPQLGRGTRGERVDESTDTYDTIEWLLANVEGHNGRVGQWGISYPGFYTSAGMIDSHPALRAASPQAPIADWFWDDMHHHGAFILQLSFNFFATFGKPRPEPTAERPERFEHKTPDAYQFFLDLGPLRNANEKHLKGQIEFWNEMTKHPNYDEFWQSRNILPHLENIKAAVLVVGGWFDTEDLYGPLATYRAVEAQNPGIDNRIVMGPWFHGGWARSDGDRLGDAEFGFKTSEYYREHVEFPFFLHHLDDGPDPGLPEALAFETGANRWRRFEAWPPPGAERRKLYLRAGGGLSFDPPAEEQGGDSYPSDPAKPVPYTTEISASWSRSHMTADQRFAARRPDVLVYRGEVLERDLTVAGPLEAVLWVSTTGTDSDFVVKLIDVYPDVIPGRDDDARGRRPERPAPPAADAEPDRGGQQTLVRAEVFRGRFRESYEKPRPFVPGQVTRVAFRLQDVLHTFQRGHRVMVQIQSTWFPFVDRNPQKYVPNIFEAQPSDFIPVTNRVERSKRFPSHVEIGVLE